LSTQHKLISPRPLGPTHILLLYLSAPLCSNNVDVHRPSGGGYNHPVPTTATTPARELQEVPINDLLFILNVPNFIPFREDGVTLTLPPRLHQQIPRLLLKVPHLETFSELTIYLHTKNQAELFRSLIPEWIRDIMHPLPLPLSHLKHSGVSIRSSSRQSLDSNSNNNHKRVTSSGGLAWLYKRRRPRKPTFGFLGSGSASSSCSSVDSFASTSTLGTSRPASISSYYYASTPEPERTVDIIARELVQAAQIIPPSALNPPNRVKANDDDNSESLIRIASLLDALRDNLDYVGFYNPTLWSELEVSRDILIRAVSYQAKIAEC